MASVTVEELDEWEDAFGTPVVKGTRNAIDLPAFYDFSEERYRFIENGSRIQDPDADSTRFTDQDEQFLIEPDAGDTLEFRSAESPRYIVGSDAAVSWSFKFGDGSGLVDADDVFRTFLGDAFELEYDGAGNVAFRSLDNGTVQKEKSVSVPVDVETPTRPEITFNWYAVGRAEVEIDYTDSGVQNTTNATVITVDDDWLSGDPTGPIGFELDVTNAGIVLEAGSIAYIEQTDTAPTGRIKPHVLSADELPQIAATGYTALAALRIDPDRDNVFTTLSEVSVAADASVDVELFITAVAPADTDADFLDPDDDGTDEGPAYPRNNSPQNNVLQWTPNVDTFPTRTYAVDGSTIPNGRSVGAAVETTAGVGGQTTKASRTFTKKRPIYPDDVVLLIGHTPNADTATEVDVFLVTDQDW